MCGISGIVHANRHLPVPESQIAQMNDVLAHRGPDGGGVYVAPGIGLGSRRLAVLDLSDRGQMPMTTPDGRYHITYNGEVYNFRELRTFLESKGVLFRSDTDTEVVLRLYEALGPAMLDELNGMFAIAIWDVETRQLFLARDRLGVKPLYYTQYQGALYFASEQKALFAAGVPASFDPDVWAELLCFRYVAGARTPYVGIKRLLAGHYLMWNNGKVEIRRWWNLGQRARALQSSAPANPVEWFRDTFDNAVDKRRISDVPVGVLLSGGLDSSSIAAALAIKAGSPVDSFTVRFDDPGFDEGPLAKAVSDRWRLTPHEVRLSPEELHENLAHASWLNDEPLAHGSDVHLWAIARHAKPHVTVLLSGEGADECLGGYVRYQPLRYPSLLGPARAVLPRLVRRMAPSGRVRKLTNFLALSSVRDLVLFNACDALPADLPLLGVSTAARFPFRERIVDEAQALYPQDLTRQAMYSDLHTFLCSLLDRNDRMTMGASIECRVPFLDVRLVEGLAALPSSALRRGYQSKRLLRQALGDRLPEAVLGAKKWGFGVPWRRYLRHVPIFRESVDRLPTHDLIREGPFMPGAIREVVKRYWLGDDSVEPLIKQLLSTTTWYDACCRRSAATGRQLGPRPYSRQVAAN